MPVELRLGAVADSLDKIENTQMRDIATLGSVAHKTNAKLRGALAETLAREFRESVDYVQGYRPISLML